MRIVVDFDGTIVNTDKAVVDMYRKDTGDYSTNYKENDAWNYNKVCPLWSRQDQVDVFKRKELFEVLDAFEDAISTLKKLHEEGHEIIIATVHHFSGIPYKAEWIRSNLPFVDKIVFIDLFNGEGTEFKMDKSFIYGDVIIEDNLDNLNTSPCKHKLCYGSYGYNKEWTGDRFLNWKSIYNYIVGLQFHEENKKLALTCK